LHEDFVLVKSDERAQGMRRELGVEDGAGGPVAWEEFVRIYGRQVIRWCRHHGLQATDAEDVAQDILAKFWKMAGSFEYDPQRRFRGYLRQMVVSAVSDWSSRRATRPMKGGDDAEEVLTSLPARDDLVSRIEEAYDTELLGVAMNAVKARVEPHTWKAFELLALEGLSGAEVATQLGIKQNTAYVARKKVQRMIREAVESLQGGEPSSREARPRPPAE